MSKLFGPSIDALAKSMAFLDARNRIIANNIANAATPGYKARRAPLAEFQQALAKAIESRHSGADGIVLPSTPHIRDGRDGLCVTAQIDPNPSDILRHDGNNVNLETEMASLAENTLMHGVLANLLRKQFTMLKAAISERVDI
jgi:flagellar basal-body rod protein FlgB